MIRLRSIVLVVVVLSNPLFAQFRTGAADQKGGGDTVSCGQQRVMEDLFSTRPDLKRKHTMVEQSIRSDQLAGKLISKNYSGKNTAVVTLPVAIHIIHNNGTENIPDAQAIAAIQHLNEAFANTGFYDPSDGVNTQIQFCLAQREPANNATNGITRDVSPFTVMGGPTYYSDDINVKNIRRWDPNCYINIWVVRSIPGSVAGYAYLPSAHGTNVDGILVEAAYFGSSSTNDVVIIHEMGHYLGLYHTFEGSCTNNDCSADGDRVCDTPPDQSTSGIPCGASMNSCSTDALSGFATDQPDLTQDYMDYGNFNCMKVFTAGQAARMNWFIQNVRSSLLHCKSCMVPCPAPVIAASSMPGSTVNSGSSFTFVNSSTNASSYEWWVNGVLQSTATNFAYTFPAVGIYNVELIARSGNPLCDSARQQLLINAVCPLVASFTSSGTTVGAGSTISFTNTSTGATNFQWSVNGTAQSTATNFSYTTVTAGQYIITLTATNTAAACNQQFSDTVYFTCPVIADFTPAPVTTLLNTPVTFTSTSTGATNYLWVIDGVPAGTGTSVTHTFTTAGSHSIKLVADNGVCYAAKSSVAYMTDQCGNPIYHYRNLYAGVSPTVNMAMTIAPDGGTVNAMRAQLSSVANAGLLKIDIAGNVQWSKTYGSGSYSDFVKVRSTLDGGYIAIGNIAGIGSTQGNNLFIVKTAADGSIAWSRQLSLDVTTNGTNVIQSPEGDYYFTGNIIGNGVLNPTIDALVGRISAAGVLMWLQSYDGRGGEVTTGLASDGGSIIVCGNQQSQNGTAGFLLQLAKANGAVNWGRTYRAGYENFRDVLRTASGYFVEGWKDNIAAATPMDHVYIVTDLAGAIISSRYTNPFVPGVTVGMSSIVQKSNGNIVSQVSSLFGATYQDFVLQELDMNAGLQWSRTYSEPNSWLTGLAVKPGDALYASGFTFNGGVNVLQLSLDTAGDIDSCPPTGVAMDLLPVNYNVTVADFRAQLVQPIVRNEHAATDLVINSTTLCQYIGCDEVVDDCAACQTINIIGPDSICGNATIYKYEAIRDAGCSLPITWQVLGTTATMTNPTDTTIEINVTGTGPIRIVGTLITMCEVITDTIVVETFQQTGTIDLGPDIALCKESTIKLRAPGGFTSYQWQDGSTDSTFTAFLPGTYYVHALDRCSNRFGDTIIISQAPDQLLDIGRDTTICRGDSIQLTASAGFVSYSWSPGKYAINDPYSRTPKVAPLVDTMYTCVAFKYEGCIVVDTIKISVADKPGELLPDTTEFCKGNAALLVPGGNWNGYLWSTGAITSTIQVRNTGEYWLRVTNSSGCGNRDTVYVKEKPCISGMNFPTAFTPNGDGLNDVFRCLTDIAPEEYYLVVYNRWGEKVFETTNYAAGWNGIFRGRGEASAVFMWYAKFKLVGISKEEMRKGIVTLIR